MTGDKELIKRNFSRYAGHYDKYCNIQNECAARLINKLNGADFHNILDIGCGTGNYTRLLRRKFPDARIKAVDISGKMIERARGKLSAEKTKFITTDAETINLTV